MEFKIGELYYNSMLGVCVITDVYPKEGRSNSPIHGERLGVFQRLNNNKAEYTLYSTSKFREIQDADIIDYLSYRLCTIELEKGIDISFSDDGILIGKDDNCVSLNKEQTLILREILSREIN